jgi:hypothetical protein
MCHYIGRGGRGLYVNADGTQFPRTIPHLFYRNLATVVTKDWDFTKFVPEAVFLTMGQNDYRVTKWVPVHVRCACVCACARGGGGGVCGFACLRACVPVRPNRSPFPTQPLLLHCESAPAACGVHMWPVSRRPSSLPRSHAVAPPSSLLYARIRLPPVLTPACNC